MNLKGCYSHKSDNWSTPNDIYNHFINELGCKDPCPLYSKEDNLNNIYKEDLFINPPYSEIDKWIDFIFKHYLNYIFLLIPARTDTKYFHKLINETNRTIELYFIKGRLKFGNSKLSAPFPSVLIKIYPLRKYLNKQLTSYFIERERVIQIGK